MMNVIVNGASRGIGRAVVKAYLNHSIDTIYIVGRDERALYSLVKECKSLNSDCNVCAIPGDICDDSFHKQLKQVIGESTIDVLINNAGVLLNKKFEDYSVADFDLIYKTNVIGIAHTIQTVLPNLSSSKRAHVINISSMGGFQGASKFKGLSVYSSSKAALASLTECLAEEYKETNIKFNCLALGGVNTKMLEKAFPGYDSGMSPEEMAKYITSFSVQGSKYFNGKIIPVSKSVP